MDISLLFCLFMVVLAIAVCLFSTWVADRLSMWYTTGICKGKGLRTANGKIVRFSKCEGAHNTEISYMPVVLFSADGVVHEESIKTLGSADSGLRVGQEITILYKKDNPCECKALSTELAVLKALFGVAVFMVLVVLTACILYLGIQRMWY